MDEFELPALPNPKFAMAFFSYEGWNDWELSGLPQLEADDKGSTRVAFSADQMRDYARGALQAHLAAQPAPAQVVSEVGPDVAKMVQEAKAALNNLLSATRSGEWHLMEYRKAAAAIDALGAAATQARAAASEPLSVSVREVEP